MKGFSEKLSRNQEKAIVALLSHSTIAEAAKACGVAEVTLWRWLQIAEFQQSYREARRTAVEQAIGELQRLTNEAAQTLKRNLTCGNAATEVRAALGILEQAFKGAELLDMEERLANIEAALPKPQAVGRKAG